MQIPRSQLILALALAIMTPSFLVAGRMPSVSSISPTQAMANSSSFTLTMTGKFFNSGDSITWNGTRLTTTLLSGTQAQAVVSSAYLTSAGTVQVAMWDARSGALSNSVTFTIQPATSPSPAPVSVAVSPSNVTLTTGGTQQFSASVSGTTNTSVTWSVGSGGGTISSSGLYAAPSTAGTATVMATSIASPNTSGLANVTINTPITMLVSASPTSLTFSSVLVGASSSSQVRLSNTGNSAVTLSSANMTGAGFSISGLIFPFTLAAGASTAATVTFAPTISGSAAGTASFASNATNSPATVSLSGSATVPVQHSVTLSWQASSSTVTGYNVYRATTSGGPYSVLNSLPDASTSYVDATVQSGQTYYYAVTAVSTTGLESAYSNQVTAAIPTP